MFRSTRPSSQSYQVAAVCGEPSDPRVATIAGFGRARKASTSGGTGTRGTPRSLRIRGRRCCAPLLGQGSVGQHALLDVHEEPLPLLLVQLDRLARPAVARNGALDGGA